MENGEGTLKRWERAVREFDDVVRVVDIYGSAVP
jgi:hypothetical protein